MKGLLPVSGMYHLGVVVEDAEKSMRNFSEVFGIDTWEVRYLTDEHFGDARVHGKKVRQNFVSAVGMGGAICFELCQPMEGDNTVYAEFLEESGPGLHHVFPTVIDEAQFKALLPELEKRGIGFAQSAAITDKIDYWYLDTCQQLGNMVEIIVLKEPGAAGNDPHRLLKFGPDVTAQAGRMPVDKFYHYTVTDRRPAAEIKRGYEDLFGMSAWYDFENIPGESVRDPRYDGKPGDYRFHAWSGREGELGVEIVQPLGGDSIFEEKLARGGPGMHHLMTTITNAAEWEKSQTWMAQNGMSIAQDAWTPDGSTYIAFVDAREKLDGMYLEVLVRQDDSVPMEGEVADILTGR